MDWNPLWRPFTNLAKGAIDEVSAKIADSSEGINGRLEQGALQMKAAWNGAAESSKFVYEDTFGAEKHLQKAAEHLANARDAAAAIKNDSADTSKNLKEGSVALTNAYNSVRGFSLNPDKDKIPPIDPTRSEAPVPQDQTESVTGGRGGRGGGGGGNGGGNGGGMGGGSNAPSTYNERVGELRGAALQAPHDQRAADLAGKGMYGSSVRAQDQGQRAFDRAMDSARVKDAAGEYEFDGRKAGNAGEAFSAYKKMLGLSASDTLKFQLGDEYDKTKSEEENFKKKLLQNAKTPQEKLKEEEKNAGDTKGGGRGGGGGDPSDASGKLDKIISIMEKRLPIRVLAA
jgi:hypothetical protein